jgi:hypothetical protein
MKSIFRTVATAATMLLPIAAVAAASVSFDPAEQGVSTDATGSVQVWVSGTTVGSFDLNIRASNSNLSWNSAVYSPNMPLGDPSTLPDAEADFSFAISGQDIRVIGYSWLGAFGEPVPGSQTDPFLLFTLEFTAGASDGATFLSFASLGDPQLGTNVTDWDGNYVADASFGRACVRVGSTTECGGNNQVPEPSAFALAALALLAAGWTSRGRRQGTTRVS